MKIKLDNFLKYFKKELAFEYVIEQYNLLLQEDGVEINRSKIMTTPVSTMLYMTECVLHNEFKPPMDEWHSVRIECKVVDNLGNEYKTIYN